MSSPNESPGTWSRRSLRTHLLSAQLSLLLITVLGFGTATYLLMRRAIYNEAESDLLGAAQLIAKGSREDSGTVVIDRTYRHRFGPAPRDHAYFAVWNAQGDILVASDPLPPHVSRPDESPPIDGPRPFATRVHGEELEVIIRGPGGAKILVGRPLAKEGDRLRGLVRYLLAAGGVVLTIGAFAAWRLANRIVRPLEQLTAAAEQISATRLDRRLGLPSASSEIQRLSDVFNRMLGRLQSSFDQQVRFTADASHELRTPVTVILTQADHTLSRPRSNEEYAEALAACLRAARRMKRLVDDLLLLARADAGRLNSSHEACDLAEVAASTLDMLAPLAGNRNVRIQSQLQPTPIHGDAAQLSQVIANLVTNAIDHSPANSGVFVSVYPHREHALLTVADAGSGISVEDQPRLFERFYQADKSRSRQLGQGAGLGLSIVAEIVSLHSGSVDFSSASDRGTTFTVELPLRTPDLEIGETSA
ncbi:ATP-binding protein [Lacipirellula sp.]|uniref:ATP-binding protein n=1 Tax=Lacipirellula sp. TaxID=2691419 RepID=UPI003D11A980